MKSSKAPLILSLFILIVFVVPVCYLFIGAVFFQSGGNTLNFGTLLSIMTSPRFLTSFVNTLILAFGTTTLAITLGIVYAWITTRTDVPGKRILAWIPVLGLTMPFLVKAFAWIFLFSPRIGLINLASKQFLGIGPIFNIYSMYALIVVGALGSLPLAYLTIQPAMRSLDPALEESSRIAGNGILRTLIKVTLPVLLPAILSAFLLILIMGLESFDYVLLIGTPAGIYTLSTNVYFWISESMPPNYGAAALTSQIFLILTLAVYTIYIWNTRRAFKFVVVTGKAAQQTVHRLGKWKYWAFAICFFAILFSFILPFSTIVLMSVTTFFTAAGGHLSLTFTTQNFADAIRLPLFLQALVNTVGLALLTATVGTLLAAFVSYAALKSKSKGARLIEYVGSIPMAFPGIVYGLGIFWTFLLLPGVSDILYGTIWPLVIALTIIRLPYSIRMISASLMQISDELEEASRITGANWAKAFRSIVLPLLKGGLTNSFLYTFINCLRELGAVILLVTPQTMVITVLLLNLYDQHPLALNTIAAASLILCVLTTGGLITYSALQYILDRRKTKKSQAFSDSQVL